MTMRTKLQCASVTVFILSVTSFIVIISYTSRTNTRAQFEKQELDDYLRNRPNSIRDSIRKRQLSSSRERKNGNATEILANKKRELSNVDRAGVDEDYNFDTGEKTSTKTQIVVTAKQTTNGSSLFFPQHKVTKTFRLVDRGENIQAGTVQVHIPTAVHYDNYPVPSGFNVFLNGWARHNDSMNFKCCFLHSFTPSPKTQSVTFTEVQSQVYNVYKQWIVDMQNAEFTCSLPQEYMTSIGKSQFDYVTLVKDSCLDAPGDVMRIEYPKKVANSVGLCLKVSYGKLDPEKVLEWFEYSKLMGVTKVFTYYFDVDPPGMKVLRYYNTTGFLDLVLIHPAKSKNGKDRGFRHPRYSEQAFVDEVMGVNDCKHRMSNYDYVIVMDVDEFIVPLGEMSTYHQVLKAASTKYPTAGGFQIDSYVVVTSWGATRDSPLHLTRYVNRTSVVNYDGAHRNTRWAFMPHRTFYARNNFVYVRKGFAVEPIPHDFYKLFHYRSCKRQWGDCAKTPKETDKAILKYEVPLISNIVKLPLSELLDSNPAYVKKVTQWWENYQRRKL
ncbi:uncharacterized protein LOC131955868 isoform X2 [Physella acuta]|uniref:uncharacterized protein LOC131955868 isoform X2 n=1 Tax=Physella acuta TaxID=109671 RepID=UPI0027DD3DFB|nr:uncharacterized protein LOC131955868 isoform X2 [Physella acuta]XP_059176146.1 uncharacterized protein LOC131955868 isoform X2 [Physella acuta]XP_059176147.1 uncharacterized protein LOC131955868 isoform X2 [Physella acuta]